MDPQSEVRVTDEGEMVSVQWFFRWLGGLCGLGVPLGGALCEAQETWLVFLWDCFWLGPLLRHTDARFEGLAGSGRSAVMDDRFQLMMTPLEFESHVTPLQRRVALHLTVHGGEPL